MFVVRVQFCTVRVTKEVQVAFQVKAEGLGFAQEDQIRYVYIKEMFQIQNISFQSLYVPRHNLETDGVEMRGFERRGVERRGVEGCFNKES